jgi:hypothetical protein
MRSPATVAWKAAAVAATIALAACVSRDAGPPPDRLPDRLSDAQFWGLIERVSEPGGFFRSENFLSNERTFQFVIPELATPERRGRVYLGVGPEQNFTYIAALEPKLAVIVDVRRQNMLMHLMYKGLFEMSADRADFLSALFSRPRPPGVDTTTSAHALFVAYRNVAAEPVLFQQTLHALLQRLTETHGFPLDTADREGIAHVLHGFFEAGPDIDYNYPRMSGYGGSRSMPSYFELMAATDEDGVSRSYLADETRFRTVKTRQERNLIVPVVGNFAGPRAVREVGAFLREHDATVAAIYVSNVEQYLFQDGIAGHYYASLATLPLSPNTTFIRSVRPTTWDRRFSRAGVRLVSMLSPTVRFLHAYERGRIRDYEDVASITW